MSLAIPCSKCGEFVPARTHRPAIVLCPRCGGTAELLDADPHDQLDPDPKGAT